MTRINGWCLSVLLCVAVFGTSVEKARAQGGGTPLSRLHERFPWAKTYVENEVTVGVCGRAMTCAARPTDAAEAFLADHGEVFATALDLEQRFVARIKNGAKTVVGYRQRVEGLPVEGSIARVCLHDTGRPGAQRWAVVYAAGYVANPSLPLPERLVSGPQALAAARQDPRAASLTRWGEPEEVLWWDRAAGPQATTRAWKINGSGSVPQDGSWSFFVDARTGQIAAAKNNVFHAAPVPRDVTITGTVEGHRTPGLLPDTYKEGCEENDPEIGPMRNVLVQVIHNGNVYSSAYTDENGEYSLLAPNGFSGEVRALLIGPEWTVTDFDGGDQKDPPPNAPGNLSHSCVQFLPKLIEEGDPGSVVDFEFNSSGFPECSSREFCTAAVNAHVLVDQGREHFYNRAGIDSAMPCLDVYVNFGGAGLECRAQWFSGSDVSKILTNAVPQDGHCANTAFSTVLTHELGHHLIAKVLEITAAGPFHEGCADTFSMFMHGTPVIGQDAQGCPSLHRDLSTATETFPVCDAGEPGHIRGKVLGRAWFDIWGNIGGTGAALAITRDLHVAWMMLATGDHAGASPCSTTLQSAGPFTLIEVLTADDDDDDIENGTPHEDEICAAFAGRSIFPPSGFDVCQESGGHPCPADCDHSTGIGVLDILDYLCFMDRFQNQDPLACDLDTSTGVGVCDIFDALVFQNEYSLGCP